MGRTRRQHYVPVSYLKNFSFDGTRLHTWLISNNNPKIITPENLGCYQKDISISDVCLAKDYYTIDESNPQNNNGAKAMTIEKDFFQNYVEPKLSATIFLFDKLAKKILEDGNEYAVIKLTEEQRQDLALCTFFQYHRSPRLRHPIESISSLIKAIQRESRIKNNLPYDDIKGLDIAYTHADKTFMNLYLWREFYQKILSYCMLLRVSKNGNFYTSDNPVVIHKLGVKGRAVFDVNFYRDEFSIFFPLTPNLILEYYSPTNFQDALKMDDTISLVSEKYEKQVNKYQYINAEKFVFSPKNDFSVFLKPVNS